MSFAVVLYKPSMYSTNIYVVLQRCHFLFDMLVPLSCGAPWNYYIYIYIYCITRKFTAVLVDLQWTHLLWIKLQKALHALLATFHEFLKAFSPISASYQAGAARFVGVMKGEKFKYHNTSIWFVTLLPGPLQSGFTASLVWTLISWNLLFYVEIQRTHPIHSQHHIWHTAAPCFNDVHRATEISSTLQYQLLLFFFTL